ncbi:MAG: hypothetical protein NTV75_10390 [Bacteroidia bacterium]|nr:hypothetical protein [Bacteroidia bacterium]
MKKIYTLSILVLFMLSLNLSYGSVSHQNPIQPQKEVKKAKKLEQQKSQKETCDAQKKKDIELKEHSVNKQMKVKKNDTDKNIKEAVQKRNIP